MKKRSVIGGFVLLSFLGACCNKGNCCKECEERSEPKPVVVNNYINNSSNNSSNNINNNNAVNYQEAAKKPSPAPKPAPRKKKPSTEPQEVNPSRPSSPCEVSIDIEWWSQTTTRSR